MLPSLCSRDAPDGPCIALVASPLWHGACLSRCHSPDCNCLASVPELPSSLGECSCPGAPGQVWAQGHHWRCLVWLGQGGCAQWLCWEGLAQARAVRCGDAASDGPDGGLRPADEVALLPGLCGGDLRGCVWTFASSVGAWGSQSRGLRRNSKHPAMLCTQPFCTPQALVLADEGRAGCPVPVCILQEGPKVL